MSTKAQTLILFGATGDLSRRMLLPSLCALDADELLPADLEIIGTARSEMTSAEFRNFAREALETFLPAHRRGGMADFLNRLQYSQLDVTTPEGYADHIGTGLTLRRSASRAARLPRSARGVPKAPRLLRDRHRPRSDPSR